MEAERPQHLPTRVRGWSGSDPEGPGAEKTPADGLSPSPRAGDVQGHSVRHREEILPSSIFRSIPAPGTLDDAHPHWRGGLLGWLYGPSASLSWEGQHGHTQN